MRLLCLLLCLLKVCHGVWPQCFTHGYGRLWPQVTDWMILLVPMCPGPSVAARVSTWPGEAILKAVCHLCYLSFFIITRDYSWTCNCQDPVKSQERMGSIWYDWSTDYSPCLSGCMSISRGISKNQFPLQLSSVTTGSTAVYYYTRHTMRGLQCDPWHKPPGTVLMTGRSVQLTASTASGSKASADKNMNFSSWSSGLYPEAQTRHHHAQWCWRSLLSEIIRMFLFYFLLLVAVVIEVGVMCFLCIFSTTLATPAHHFFVLDHCFKLDLMLFLGIYSL
jgi:hypothetical protein